MSETIIDLGKSKIRYEVKMVEKTGNADVERPAAAEPEQSTYFSCAPWNPTES